MSSSSPTRAVAKSGKEDLSSLTRLPRADSVSEATSFRVNFGGLLAWFSSKVRDNRPRN